jgi:hypothetical protein
VYSLHFLQAYYRIAYFASILYEVGVLMPNSVFL